MPSTKLTNEQQKLNDILKNKGYYTFTSNDYVSDPDAIKLLDLYTGKTVNYFREANLVLFIYKKLKYKKDPNSKINIDTEMEKIAVKHLFRITHNPSIEKIMDSYYSDLCSQDEDGKFNYDTSLQTKIDSLVKYCQDINICFEQYEEDSHIWSKNPEAKKEYREYWEKLSNKKILSQSNDLINLYVEIINNYGVNQKTTVKAKFLLKLELKNINTLKTAKEIISNSTLFE